MPPIERGGRKPLRRERALMVDVRKVGNWFGTADSVVIYAENTPSSAADRMLPVADSTKSLAAGCAEGAPVV